MLFNCLNCCKAISSQAESCPYCMMAMSGMVAQVAPAQQSKSPQMAFFMKRSAYRARKTAEALSEKLPKSLPNVTQIVQGMRAVKH